MFEWLKVLTSGKADAKRKTVGNGSHLLIDSRRYPLVGLTARGFVAGRFDTTVAAGQNASITVVVADRWGNFTFNTRCTITTIDAAQAQFAGSFSLLAPEVEQALIQYGRNRAATQQGAKRG
jgi:hypothetical protein